MRSKKITPARRLVHRSRCLWWHVVLLACIAPFSLPAAPLPDCVVVFNEVHYNPIGATEDGEWLELFNQMGIKVDLSGWRLSGGIDYTFPAGTNSIIDPGAYLVVFKTPGAGELGPFTGSLGNAGETINLRNHSDRLMDSLGYGDSGRWPVTADGSGITLAKRKPYTPNKPPENWTRSAEIGGTPGGENFPSGPPSDNALRLNEMPAFTNAAFWIELINSGTQSVDVLDVILSVEGDPLREYELPAQSLSTGAVLVVTQAQMGFRPADSENVYLYSPAKANVLDGQGVTGRLRGRAETKDGAWLYPNAPTPNAPNTFTFRDDVVISEINYNPPPLSAPFSKSENQWIEIANRSGQAVDLAGWEFDDGISFTFPSNTVLAVGEHACLAESATEFANAFPGARLLGQYGGSLSRSGERLSLRDADRNPVDEVRYFDDGPRWPQFADGGGSSLELRDLDADNNVAEAWAPSDETDQTSWQTYYFRDFGTANGGTEYLWRDFAMGLLDAGEILIDDIRLVQDPDGTPIQFLPNIDFESGATDWRMVGNHRHSEVITDPDNAGNQVLHIISEGATEHMHNHIETTLLGTLERNLGLDGRFNVVPGYELGDGDGGLDGDTRSTLYDVSFRAKWITGCNQLHTRFWMNRVASNTHLDRPLHVGTPSAPNSRAEGNIGPTFTHFLHSPAVPDVGEAVTVTVRAADPEGVTTMDLFYSVDEGSFTSIAMSATGNGTYQATIPGQSASTIVQFYAEATDGSSAVAMFPSRGPDSRAQYMVQDGSASGTGIHNLRIVMQDSDADFMHTPKNVMSNGRMGATVIDREAEIYYDVGVRLKGSMNSRAEDIWLGFNVRFAGDQLYRGVHRSVSIDRSGTPAEAPTELMFDLAISNSGGSPSRYNDLVHVIAPRDRHDGASILQMARYGDVFLSSQYDQGDDGFLYKYELIYQTTQDDANGFKLPPASRISTAPVGLGSGTDVERYRWHFMTKNNRAQDNFDPIMAYNQHFGKSGTAFELGLDELVDVDELLRGFAYAVISGAGDNVGAGSTHNGMYYVKPDGRVTFLPHDMDYQYSATRSIFPNNEVTKLTDTPSNPENAARRRIYLGHLYDIATTSWNDSYMSTWSTHLNTLDPDSYWSRTLTHMEDRANNVLGQINTSIPLVSFSLTTASPLTVGSSTATVSGEGWVNVREFRISFEGVAGPLTAVEWTDGDSWTAQIPVFPGSHTYTIEAYDFSGALVGTDTIIVNNTSPGEPPSAANLVVSELMYNPAAPTAAEVAAGVIDADQFEFIELFNSGSDTLDLTALAFTNGIDYAFADGPVTWLAAGNCIVLARDPAAFATRYATNALLLTGPYGGKFGNGGEAVGLVGPYGAVIAEFTYSDGRSWPLAADGAGHALVPTGHGLAGQNEGSLSYGGNWRASTYIGGSPGVTNPAPIVDVVINEFAAHTDTTNAAPLDSDDWIELYNTSPGNVTLTSWYLSDDADELMKWKIPASNVIDTASWLTFTERTGFNSEGTNGFGLNKAGEQIFLSYLPGTDQDRVADSVSFKGQKNEASWGRYGDGAEVWYPMTPTTNAANQLALFEPVISEIMYHPAAVGTNAADNSDHEYVVIQNDTGADVDLWNAVGPWRINGIGYTLPSNTVISAGAALTIVAFDPGDAVAVSNFLAAHNLSGTSPDLRGPHNGTLSNTGERLALERPQDPDVVGDSISWVTVDEVIYSASAPWPDASTNGTALYRINLRHSGNDPLNWAALQPTLARPKVVLTSPRNGSHMLIPFSHTATAVLNTNKLDGVLQHVEFFLNGSSIETDTSAPFEAVIDHTRVATAGTYTVYARVVDGGGGESSVASVFTAELAPRVAITSPGDHASFVLPFNTTLEASVDAEHVVGDVEVTFFNGTTSLGTVSNTPYELAVNYANFPAPDTYELYAVLDDGYGSTTSQVSHLIVGGFAPRVEITSPADGASFLLPFSTTLEASVDAEHVVGDVTVTFFNGTTSLGVSAINGPYEIAVSYTNFPAPATYPLHAVLVDDYGSTTSQMSNLIVDDFATRVAITSPTSGTSVLPHFNTTLVAWVDAAYVVGGGEVTFLNGTNILAEHVTSPYEFALNWTHFSGGGDYELYAVLTDDFASSTSQVSSLTIDTLRGLPFEDGFDAGDGHALGDDLNGKAPSAHGNNPWVASGVVVTNDPFHAGGQAAALTDPTRQSVSMVQTFNGEQTNVWTDLYSQPAFGDNSGFRAPVSVAWYVQTN
ncbi:MAG: hypothetical protein HN919_20740, partial [Verrucomicrobia bacterium]|nr:hypothetical protein [Verrucomicrobiota bacterium]